MKRLIRLLSELRRRSVFRVGVVYGAVAFVALQVADLVVEPLRLPPWTMGLLILLAAVGFPLALVLAWAFEITPDGVRRTDPEPDSSARPVATGLGARDVALLGLALVVVGSAWLGLRSPGEGGGEPDPQGSPLSGDVTIAVLPFADMSPEGDHEYFADGMTEELIHLLTAVEGVRSIPRTSAFAFKGQGGDVRDMGRALGAEFVLEGSVRRFQDRLRITAQLVDVVAGVTLRSDSWERQVEDIFLMQDEIARSIVDALRGHLPAGVLGEARESEEADFEAYDLYLRGRFFWHRRTEEGLRQARGLFQEAVSRAPQYARGWVGLADAYAVLGFYEYLPPGDAFPRARAAAERALELDAELAEAHATLGYVALYYEWDHGRAEGEFLRALELDSTYATGHQWYGNLLTAQGRFGEAERAMRRAAEWDPLSLIARGALAWSLHYGGENERALVELARVLAVDPEFQVAHLWRGQALKALGRLGEAELALDRAVELSGGGDLALAARARLRALQGRETEALEILGTLEHGGPDEYVPSYELARGYATLGDEERALAWLERARNERVRSMVFLEVEPAFVPLRGHPRFQELVREVVGGT